MVFHGIPISLVSTVGTLVVKIGEATFRMKAVDDELASILKMTEHLCQQLEKAQSEYILKKPFLNPNDQEWIEHAIQEARKAVDDVAAIIEPGRVDHEVNEGHVRSGNRAMWVLRDSYKVKEKQAFMQQCHTTLMTAILSLQATPTIAETLNNNNGSNNRSMQDEFPPSYEISQLIAWKRTARTV